MPWAGRDAGRLAKRRLETTLSELLDVMAGYNHSIANIMTTAALRTGEFVTFDEENQEVLAGGKVFKY